MPLIKSISGIRGTIGGAQNDGLSPVDIVKFSAAFATLLKEQLGQPKLTLVVGRDARISGEMVNHLVVGALMSMGCDVIDLGLSTTPTVEMGVILNKADGGIIITASHNPKQWNALKLLNHKGEFISADEGTKMLEIAEKDSITYSSVKEMGKYTVDETMIDQHIQQILNLKLVDVEAIKAANFCVAIDAVNSTGGIAVPALLKALGVNKIIDVHCDPTGDFAHNPEPLPENLIDLTNAVVKNKADVGFAVDPDVDRLAIVCENGDYFGEEYTLVAIADYVLQNTPGNTVSNLSSTRALKELTEKAGQQYLATAVGEVNVVEGMKKINAIIGGEGNGGIILPELHYGRDALVGIALFLTYLAKEKTFCSNLRYKYPNYTISKNKIELSADFKPDDILEKMKIKYAKQPVDTQDGVKIEFDKDWVHLRKSNTEPIIRIYAESDSEVTADNLAKKIIEDIQEIVRNC